MKKKIFYLVMFICITSCQSQKETTPEQRAILKKAKENFVFVEGGTFTMGDNGDRLTYAHEVTLDSYSISKYETTWKEYDTYTSIENLGLHKPKYRKLENYGQNHPVKQVNWFESRAYCQWLGKQLNLPIDLATEAQWEYAARSRGMNVGHATNNGNIGEYEPGKYNYGSNDNEVGYYPPNPLGIYDMSGSRPEWVLDYSRAYPRKHVKNPIRDTIDKVDSEPTRMVRGYHTLDRSVYKRNGAREPENTGTGITIRCVCNQKTPIN